MKHQAPDLLIVHQCTLVEQVYNTNVMHGLIGLYIVGGDITSLKP